MSWLKGSESSLRGCSQTALRGHIYDNTSPPHCRSTPYQALYSVQPPSRRLLTDRDAIKTK